MALIILYNLPTEQFLSLIILFNLSTEQFLALIILLNLPTEQFLALIILFNLPTEQFMSSIILYNLPTQQLLSLIILDNLPTEQFLSVIILFNLPTEQFLSLIILYNLPTEQFLSLIILYNLPTGEDILFAMSTLGFDNYVEPLKLYLQKYREAMKVKMSVLMSNNPDFCRERGRSRLSSPTWGEGMSWEASSCRSMWQATTSHQDSTTTLLTSTRQKSQECNIILQALTASEGDVLLTYSNGQQFQL